MGYLPALGGKAAHLVSDLATVILNPVSERERHHSSHLPVSAPRLLYAAGPSGLLRNSVTFLVQNRPISERNRVMRVEIGV